MTQPEWATPIIKEVCRQHKRKLPKMKWIRRNRKCSSGICYPRSITICAGTEQLDQKQVLLHELSHWICGKRKQKGHTVRFWRKLFELLKQYECETEAFRKREFQYKKKAELVYNSL